MCQSKRSAISHHDPSVDADLRAPYGHSFGAGLEDAPAEFEARRARAPSKREREDEIGREGKDCDRRESKHEFRAEKHRGEQEEESSERPKYAEF